MADLKANMKMLIPTSRFSSERAFDSVNTDSKHGSTLAFEDSLKNHEANMQSSDGDASARPTSVKSETSTEMNLHLKNGRLEMVVRETHESNINAAQDRSNTTTHDSQHRTESSSSNSLPVVLPISFSNQSFREASKEAYSFRNYVSSMDSSNCKAFDLSPEGQVMASFESGVFAQIACEAMRNATSKNNMKISLMAGKHTPLMSKKGDEEISHKWDLETVTSEDGVGEVLEQTDMYKWISQSTSSTEDQNPGAIGRNSACSDNLDSFNCTRKNMKNMRLSDEHNNLLTCHSGEKMEYEISREGELSKYDMKAQDKLIAGFDLNEDINVNVLDDCVQPVVASISSHNVIYVVAKAGISTGQPMIPLKFEGGLGWKGSAETSAFRPVTLSKTLDRITNHRPKDAECFTGIDLNVTALEDNDANGIPVEPEGISSPSTLQDFHLEIDSKQGKSLGIDLNCLYDAADEFSQPSLPPKSENCPMVDLNLTSNASAAEKSNNVHWQGCLQSPVNKNSDTSNPEKQDFNFTSPTYFANLSTVQHLANCAHTLVEVPQFLQEVEPIKTIASMQPKLPLMSYTLPPHSYYPRDSFCFGSSVPSNIYQSGTKPYTRYYHEHGIFPEALGPVPGHASFDAPHLSQVFHEQSTSKSSASIPRLDVKAEHHLSTSGNKMDEHRQVPLLAINSPMGERIHQGAWYVMPMKRKETEGGLEHYQLGYKQVT